ncbi:hypothetical protein NPIL_148131, partial [Nephila pilipes]
ILPSLKPLNNSTLEVLTKQIRDADERRKKLEQQKLAAATELQAKQEEIKTLSNEAERQKAMENIQNLEVSPSLITS